MKQSKPSKKDSQWKLEVHQLDVGQGDSALILFKKLNPSTKKHEVEKSILIDGGLGHSTDYLNQFIKDKIGAVRNLDAVIITHYDGDHYMGIAQNMFMILGKKGGKGIENILREKQNPHFTKDTKFILPTAADNNAQLVHGGIQQYYGDFDYSAGSYRNIFHNLKLVGYGIWDVFGGKPEGAPDLKIVAADNYYNPYNTKNAKNDNQRSTVSIVGMNNFHFYTAGDFEDNNSLLVYLAAQPNSNEFLPIQAFLHPHHGSKKNIPNSNGARAAIISAGKGSGNYDHPDIESLNSIHNNGVAFTYSTNRSGSLKDKLLEKKFVIAGQDHLVTASDTNKFTRGTIRVQTYQNIAEVGSEKFMVKYKSVGSKTRDYFKNKNFDNLRAELAATGITKTQTLQLSERDLRHFLDKGNELGQQRKIKHLNPETIRNFAASYNPADSAPRNYSLDISANNNEISFEISSNSWQPIGLNTTRPFPEKWQAEALVDRVRKLTPNGNRVRIYLTGDEAQSFFNGSNLTHLVERREADRMTSGYHFLEVMNPNDNKQIPTQLWSFQKKPILRKEYHKDKDKLVARRVEFGDANYRTVVIPLSHEEQEQINRLRNYVAYYADDELNSICRLHLPLNSEYISPAVALIPEELDKALQDFKNNLEKTQAAIAIHTRNHFVGIHIKKEADGYSITYFDPTVDKDYNLPLHDLPVHVAAALDHNFSGVKITPTSSSIQTYTRLSDGAIAIDNNHCGAFLGCVLTEMANENARVNPDGSRKIQIKLPQGWINMDDLSSEQSNSLGVRIRDYHADYLSKKYVGLNIGKDGQFSVLRNFISEIKKSQIELGNWRIGILKNPPQQFSKEDYENLSKMVKTSEFQYNPNLKTIISQAIVEVMRNNQYRDLKTVADEFFANLSEKNLIDHNYTKNGGPLVYRASFNDYPKLFTSLCGKCSDATIEYVHASDNSTSLIMSVLKGWHEESKIACERMMPETINKRYNSTNPLHNNKTALLLAMEGNLDPEKKMDLCSALISNGAKIGKEIEEHPFYKSNFVKPPSTSVTNVVVDGLLKYAKDIELG